MQKNASPNAEQLLDLLHNVAHDIRNPLTVFLHGTEILLEPRVGPLNEEQLVIAKSLHKQARTLHTILNEILDFHKIESGHYGLEKVPALFSHVLEVTLDEMDEQAKPSQVQFHLVNRLPQFFTVALDVARIRQVLRNLLTNAIKYAPQKSTITLVAEKKDKNLLVSCSNKGPQIPTEKLESIFEKFVTVKNGQKIGDGLGLAICRNIIELHQGRIWAENLESQGVKFSFTIPLAN